MITLIEQATAAKEEVHEARWPKYLSPRLPLFRHPQGRRRPSRSQQEAFSNRGRGDVEKGSFA